MTDLDRLTERLPWISLRPIVKHLKVHARTLATTKSKLRQANLEHAAMEQSQLATVTPASIMRLLTALKKATSVARDDTSSDANLLAMIYTGKLSDIDRKRDATDAALRAVLPALIVAIQGLLTDADIDWDPYAPKIDSLNEAPTPDSTLLRGYLEHLSQPIYIDMLATQRKHAEIKQRKQEKAQKRSAEMAAPITDLTKGDLLKMMKELRVKQARNTKGQAKPARKKQSGKSSPRRRSPSPRRRSPSPRQPSPSKNGQGGQQRRQPVRPASNARGPKGPRPNASSASKKRSPQKHTASASKRRRN